MKCRRYGISLNPKKSQFALNEGKFLGHIVSTEGVKINPVAGIYPYYRGRNGSLLSIGQKGRFLHVERIKIKMECKWIETKLRTERRKWRNDGNNGEPLYKHKLGFRFRIPANKF